MYLKSIRVANYRVHRNTYVEFDRHLTLIAGPNESGKSTLVEAMHRVLFMKARTTGEFQKEIVSLSTAEAPEVELTFSKRNCEYKLHKKFAGTRGTTLLTSSQHLNLRENEAEERLAELLGLKATRYSPEHWSHLWAWQGTSTQNLLTENSAFHNDFIPKLQNLGTAGLLQSNLDTQVNQKIRETYDSIFTKNNSYKANSDVSMSERALEECRDQRDSKRKRSVEIRDAAEQYENAENQLKLIESRKKEHRKSLDSYRQRQKQVNSINENLGSLKHDLRDKQKNLDDLKTAQQKLESLQSQRRKAERRLDDIKPQVDIVQQSLKTLQDEITTLTSQESELIKLLRVTRLKASLEQTENQWTDKQRELRRLKTQVEQIDSQKQQRDALTLQLAAIPDITKNNLQSLKQLSLNILQAESSLRAMAASIKLLQSDLPVTLKGQPLSPDTEYPISAPTELSIGDNTRVIITPGDGTSLADAQQNLSNLKQQRDDKLDELTLKSLEEAERFYEQRTELSQKINAISTNLRSLDAVQITQQYADIQQLETQLRSKQERDANHLTEVLSTSEIVLPVLSNEESWQSRAESLERERDNLSNQLRMKNFERESYEKRKNELENETKDCDREIKTADEGINQQEQILGDPAQHETKLADLKNDIERQQKEIEQLQATLTELQPEHLERLIQRQEDSLEALNREESNFISLRAEAMTKIRRDGSTDITTELAMAESACQFAESQLELHQREANASKLLKELFELERQTMSEALTAPFVQRIKKYTRYFTGEITQIAFEMTTTGFNQLRIVRPRDNNSAVNFEYLSGGAKEQISAAARLAIAEVLASNSEDGLPLVFDDAFSFTDSNRLEALPFMLEHAIEAGLQIIIASCNPLPYARLGAKTITLPGA
jgi:DNA repair exonuclease SbcCD ATPase subunit